MAKARETLNTKWYLVTNNVIFSPLELFETGATISMRNTPNFPKWDLSLES